MNTPHVRALTVAMSLLLLPSVGTADPIARWLNPWSPAFDALTINFGSGGDASAFRGFGDRGGAGETLSGTSAKALSRALADSGFMADALAGTGVAFNRAFELSGSPDGWKVTLSGRLVGLLVAVPPTAPTPVVTAGAQIIAGGPSLLWGPTTVLPAASPLEVDDAMVGHAMLGDGTYTVVGFLRTSASVRETLSASTGRASADFASRGLDGFHVGVDAVPVPEPSSFVLLGTGLIALRRVCRTGRDNTKNGGS